MPDDVMPAGGALVADEHLDAVRRLLDEAQPVDVAPGTGDDGNGHGEPPEDDGEPGPPDDAALALFEPNDTGNAHRLVERHGGDLIHVEGIGWHYWDGARYNAELGDPKAVERAQWTQSAMWAELKALRSLGPPPPDELEEASEGAVQDALKLERIKRWERQMQAFEAHIIKSGNRSQIRGMLEMALPDLSQPYREMDSDPWLLTVDNGTLDLRPVEDRKVPGFDGCSDQVWAPVLRGHRKRDRITRLVPVAYEPGAACPAWEAFLARILPGDEVRLFVQRLFGYALLGVTDEQCLAVLWGTGKNGKSTLVDVLREVFGDYAATVPVGVFLDDGHVKADGPRPSLAKLPGRRLVLMSEPKKGAKLDEALVKEITGGEPLETRGLQRDPIEFRPRFLPVMSTNHKPEIRGLDPGIWRRIILIPFKVFIPENERNPRLKEKLLAEKAGILRWLLDGLKSWHEQGLAPPNEVVEAVEEYRADSDPLKEFLEAETHICAGKRVSSTDLYKAYEDWCARNAAEPLKQNGFSRRLKDRGFRTIKASVNFWDGLELLPPNHVEGLA